ncbi:MAG: hypothetical protein LIP09_13555 [Bacteroidales bacterium]|nr:hypothetical protein [Bacteroidales bacterium]
MTSVRKWCNTMYWDTYAPHGTQLFENGYRDQPLDEPLLDHWRNYLDYEPRRLSFISTNPEFFTCVHELSCAGAQYLCLGNPFLLDIPLKQTVIASDTENQRQFQPKWNQYMECGACGGVLISAATTSRERAVMSQALERKYNIIWIRESDAQPRFPLFSPAHNACQRGNLLLLSPMGFSGIRNLLTPEQRTYLNNLATELSAPALSYQLHQGFESGFVHIPPTCVTVCGVDEGQA